MKNRVKVLENDWDNFATYLFYDRKLARSKRSLSANKYLFNKLCKHFKEKEFNRTNFTQYIASLQQSGLSESYLNKIITTARHIDKYRNINQLQDFSYFKEHYKTIEVLTFDEMESMAKHNVSYRYNPEIKNKKYQCLIYFLSTTGCRLSECLDLSWSDIGDRTVRFNDTKNGEVRIIPIKNKLYEMMKDLPKISNLVFSSKTCKRMNESQVREDLRRRATECGINKHIYPHIFRHSWITNSIKMGINRTYIQRIVGHKDPASTDHYAQLVVEDLRETIEFYPVLKERISLELIRNRIINFMEKIVDKNDYSLTVKDTKEAIAIRIKRAYI